VATSTFGGGGGTKVFCSQALNIAKADMTNAIREAVAALCKREDFIAVPQLRSASVQRNAIYSRRRRLLKRRSVTPLIARLHLQWNRKPKMICFLGRVERELPAITAEGMRKKVYSKQFNKKDLLRCSTR
jgi:hypothetical protein